MKYVYIFFSKKWKNNEKTMKNLFRMIMKESKKWISQREFNPNFALSNSYNDADLIFLFKKGLYLFSETLSFNSNENSLLYVVSRLTVKRWWMTAKQNVIFKGTTLWLKFIVSGDILVCSQFNAYIKFSHA